MKTALSSIYVPNIAPYQADGMITGLRAANAAVSNTWATMPEIFHHP